MLVFNFDFFSTTVPATPFALEKEVAFKPNGYPIVVLEVQVRHTL